MPTSEACQGITHQYDAAGIALVLYVLHCFQFGAVTKRMTQNKSII
jgi:hypothetical protein